MACGIGLLSILLACAGADDVDDAPRPALVVGKELADGQKLRLHLGGGQGGAAQPGRPGGPGQWQAPPPIAVRSTSPGRGMRRSRKPGT